MTRINFAEELSRSQSTLIQEGQIVHAQLERVLTALKNRDAALADEVVAGDDRVDDLYLSIHTSILNLLALQAPVAGDLRLVSAILHSNLHLERMGDLCVNIAKFVKNEMPYPASFPIAGRLQEMGAWAADMLELAMRAFAEHDVRMAEELPTKDNVLDRLNRGMLDELKAHVDDEEAFEWAANLFLVARYLERFGDHAVDIAEQIHFMVTGVFREFSDASHPELAFPQADSSFNKSG